MTTSAYMRRALVLSLMFSLMASAIANANAMPKMGVRKATVRVRDTVVRTATAPIPSKSNVRSVAFYVDGKLAPSSGVGGVCRVDYLTHRGVVVRLNACHDGPLRVSIANVGDHPHRVTVVLRFVV